MVRLGWTRARLSSLGLSLVEKWAKRGGEVDSELSDGLDLKGL